MPPIRPWHVLLVCLALVVPLQAGALEGGGSGLSVSASLGQCGVSGSGIVCRIDVSWSGVEHATRYDATVTLADGSVQDLGTVGGGGGGSTSVWVTYAGSGTYTVAVTAWGSDPEGKDEKLENDEAEAVIKDESADEDSKGKDGDKAGKNLEQPQQQPAGEDDGGGNGQAEPGTDPAPAPEEPATEAPDDEVAPVPSPTPDQESDATGGEPSKAPTAPAAPGTSEQKAQAPAE